MAEDLGLLQSEELSLHELKLAFFWSRIRSVADYSTRAQMRLRNLGFEDFLEGIVRLSLLVALPTDDVGLPTEVLIEDLDRYPLNKIVLTTHICQVDSAKPSFTQRLDKRHLTGSAGSGVAGCHLRSVPTDKPSFDRSHPRSQRCRYLTHNRA